MFENLFAVYEILDAPLRLSTMYCTLRRLKSHFSCTPLSMVSWCINHTRGLCQKGVNLLPKCLLSFCIVLICARQNVKYVAHHSITFRLNFSLIGRNVLCCSRRYGFDVSNVKNVNSRFISATIHSYARFEVTEVQMHEVDLLFECILIRDGQAALSCWFPRSDVQTTVNYLI